MKHDSGYMPYLSDFDIYGLLRMSPSDCSEGDCDEGAEDLEAYELRDGIVEVLDWADSSYEEESPKCPADWRESGGLSG